MSDDIHFTRFENTLNALSVLESQLKCSACDVLAQSPCILGGCEHIFCHVCVEKYLGASCPHCHIPAHVKDADVNRQLFNIASLCQKLRDVLSAPADDVQTVPDWEDLREAAECTPKQPIKDVFHFDTPTHTSTEEKPANQKRSRQKSSERQNQGKELKKKTDKKKATKINCYKNDKEGTGPNDKVNHYSEIGRRRRASLPRTRDAVPSDQSTMTQFYDYDDDENAENLGGARINLSELKTGISSRGNDSEGARGSVDSFKKANLERHDEKVKKKRNKAAEIITEMCKTTTRLRQKSDTDVKSLAKRNEPENWFEDGTAMESENVPAISDKPKKSSIGNHLTENITVMETEIKQGLTNTTANPVTIQYKTRGKSKKKTSEDQNSVTDADLTTAEQTDLQTKRPRSKKSRSLSSGKINVKDTDARVEQFDKTKKECNKSTPVKEVASAPKSGPRTQSKMHSERKSATPKSLKSKSAQQSSVLKAASSPRTPLLTNNKSTPLRARVSGSPAGLSPRTTLSPSNRSTPQRSKVSDVPAALSPALNKRNAKGETPLQVAAIKNDEKKVGELLAAGADPNVRDNAGWSPLHEACNRGYTAVARMLLDNGAMMNVPGLDNDTPLHDAVSNGRIESVKLLVSRGASLSARNLKGYTPEDLAVTEEMKKALRTAVKNDSTLSMQLPLDTLEYQQPCLMGTSLSREQKVVLQKCASLLSAKQSDECTPEVTHVITSCNDQGLCARTIKYLQAVLTGKWILSMDWVNTCLEFGSKVCEEGFEVQGTSTNPTAQAPLKGRMNRKQQLPGLFDGCQFYFHGNFEFSVPSKDELVEVIRSGGGKILSREPKPGHLDSLDLTVPYHANPGGNLANCCVFIMHQNLAEFQPIRTDHMCSVPVSWILESAAEFQLKDI